MKNLFSVTSFFKPLQNSKMKKLAAYFMMVFIFSTKIQDEKRV